jgi:hypothetical protein
MKNEDYFADKIERSVGFFESRLQKIDGAYLALVERRAARFKDKIWARFFRETVNPKCMAEELNRIRFLVAQGKIVEADRTLDRLKSGVELVERHLAHPYLTAGIRTSQGGKKSAAAKRGSADGRADKMRRMFEKERTKGLSKGKADEAVARFFKVSTKTVRNTRAGK